jgi:ATP-dependent RNA circularization protein (DNA/RNA ligase family)
MSGDFHKFPHTPHLVWLGEGHPREDKLLPREEADEFLSGEVLVEEKVDGANLGISLGPAGRVRPQSRGNYLAPGRCHAQWNPLWPWLAEHRAGLEDGLHGGLMLYGEWCYAKHTVPYDALPDWFLGFDIFEVASGQFWGADRRNEWLRQRGLTAVPEVKRGRLTIKRLVSLLGNSAVGRTRMEGVYLRREQEGWLTARAKVVSIAFRQQIEEHWTRRAVTANQLARAMSGDHRLPPQNTEADEL